MVGWVAEGSSSTRTPSLGRSLPTTRGEALLLQGPGSSMTRTPRWSCPGSTRCRRTGTSVSSTGAHPGNPPARRAPPRPRSPTRRFGSLRGPRRSTHRWGQCRRAAAPQPSHRFRPKEGRRLLPLQRRPDREPKPRRHRPPSRSRRIDRRHPIDSRHPVDSRHPIDSRHPTDRRRPPDRKRSTGPGHPAAPDAPLPPQRPPPARATAGRVPPPGRPPARRPTQARPQAGRHPSSPPAPSPPGSPVSSGCS